MSSSAGTARKPGVDSGIPTSSVPARPTLRERTQYRPNLPQEEFIVPLLLREIELCIDRYAAPPLGMAKAVDMGCGGQPFRALLERIGYFYCGVDANPHGGVPLDVVCEADKPIPEELLRRGPFDFLLCTEVLEHVADWDATFRNFNLLLAPGGRMLLTAPFSYQLHEEPYDFWRPTLHAIDFYARRVGLRSVYRQAAGDPWDALGTMIAACKFLPVSMRVLDRCVARVVRVATRLVTRTLLRGKLRSRVRIEAPLYLSNVVVLEKPAGSPGT